MASNTAPSSNMPAAQQTSLSRKRTASQTAQPPNSRRKVPKIDFALDPKVVAAHVAAVSKLNANKNAAQDGPTTTNAATLPPDPTSLAQAFGPDTTVSARPAIKNAKHAAIVARRRVAVRSTGPESLGPAPMSTSAGTEGQPIVLESEAEEDEKSDNAVSRTGLDDAPMDESLGGGASGDSMDVDNDVPVSALDIIDRHLKNAMGLKFMLHASISGANALDNSGLNMPPDMKQRNMVMWEEMLDKVEEKLDEFRNEDGGPDKMVQNLYEETADDDMKDPYGYLGIEKADLDNKSSKGKLFAALQNAEAKLEQSEMGRAATMAMLKASVGLVTGDWTACPRDFDERGLRSDVANGIFTVQGAVALMTRKVVVGGKEYGFSNALQALMATTNDKGQKLFRRNIAQMGEIEVVEEKVYRAHEELDELEGQIRAACQGVNEA